MSTQVWFRNPDLYIRELVECGQYDIAFDRGMLQRKKIDPVKFGALYFGAGVEYRILLVGEQGTAELRAGDVAEVPRAVYPTWRYGDDAAYLEELVARPLGADADACADKTVPPDLRPVFGQEHRVVIIEPPNVATGPGRQFMRYLKQLQEDYPDCILHIHGLYSWKMCFGQGFGAADVEPRSAAAKGKVTVPAGREYRFEKVQQHKDWVRLMGMEPNDLAVPRNRCIYNIRSAVWAGENFIKFTGFRTTIHKNVDITTPDADYVGPPGKAGKMPTPVIGDKVICDACSLSLSCKYFRDGSVCTLPGEETGRLARMFKSRNAETILTGLGELMSHNVKRIERGLEDEEEFGDLSPEVSRIMRQTFDQGAKLAQMLDPRLRGGPKVNVNIGAGAGSTNLTAITPQAFAAQAVAMLEAQGIRREDITPAMIAGLLEGMADPAATHHAIEGTVIRSEGAA